MAFDLIYGGKTDLVYLSPLLGFLLHEPRVDAGHDFIEVLATRAKCCVFSLTHILEGTYFEMPKGMKAAPPQQASLNELWNSKSKRTKPSSAARGANEEPDEKSMNESDVPKAPTEPPSSASINICLSEVHQ